MFLSPQALDVAFVAADQGTQQKWIQVAKNFENALSNNQWRQILDRMLFRSNKLKTFNEAMQDRRLIERSDLGDCVVLVEKIVGSVGRQHDFDRSFMPRSEHLKDRWLSVDRAYYQGVTLPLIELIKLDDEFYVVDGHHRISVARYHGQQYIEAHVVEVHTVVWQSCGQPTVNSVCVA
ncbi:MAG: hypothetical protein KF893_20955 [Caldilineaceae bacterium]|nr:hypothetical protein [Caldilineaceae bacterium]